VIFEQFFVVDAVDVLGLHNALFSQNRHSIVQSDQGVITISSPVVGL
jgi:hypothetical protein